MLAPFEDSDQGHGLTVRDVKNQHLLPIRTLRLSKLKNVETDLASTIFLITLLLQYLNEGKLDPPRNHALLGEMDQHQEPDDGTVRVIIESDQ